MSTDTVQSRTESGGTFKFYHVGSEVTVYKRTYADTAFLNPDGS
jgi:hypothetical protein